MAVVDYDENFFEPGDIDLGSHFDGLENAVLPLLHHGHLTDRKTLGKDPANTGGYDRVTHLYIIFPQ